MSASNERVSITLKNQLSELTSLQQVVKQFGHQHRLTAKTLNEINLILEELLTNLISYGFRDGGTHDIVIELKLESGEFQITMTDDGLSFDPSQASQPDTQASLEARSIGGLGLHLVRHYISTLSYQRSDNKNILSIRKHLNDDI